MEENGKKWKKSVVDVQIEGVLVRSPKIFNTDYSKILSKNITYDHPRILPMNIQNFPSVFPMIIPIYRYLFSLYRGRMIL